MSHQCGGLRVRSYCRSVRLELTRRADLAVRALLALGDDRRLKAVELAEELDATPSFIPQVMSPLVRARWVRSEPGPTGGYALTVDLGAVSVLQVIEAVEGPTELERCVIADRPCDEHGPCALHEAWSAARGALLTRLAATPVGSLPRS